MTRRRTYTDPPRTKGFDHKGNSLTASLVETYTYRDWDGEPRFDRLRYEHAAFPGFKRVIYGWRNRGEYHMYKPEKNPSYADRVAAPYDADEYLYNLPAIAWAVRQNRTVYWTEGEKDAETLGHGKGLAATSTHQGINGRQGSITEEQLSCLSQCPRVMLLIDDDPPGHYFAWERYDGLRSLGFKHIQIGLWLPRWGKDVTDHIEAASRRGLYYSFHRGRRPSWRELREMAAEWQPGNGLGRSRYNQGDE